MVNEACINLVYGCELIRIMYRKETKTYFTYLVSPHELVPCTSKKLKQTADWIFKQIKNHSVVSLQLFYPDTFSNEKVKKINGIISNQNNINDDKLLRQLMVFLL